MRDVKSLQYRMGKLKAKNYVVAKGRESWRVELRKRTTLRHPHIEQMRLSLLMASCLTG